jgi:hypothetical protein
MKQYLILSLIYIQDFLISSETSQYNVKLCTTMCNMIFKTEVNEVLE